MQSGCPYYLHPIRFIDIFLVWHVDKRNYVQWSVVLLLHAAEVRDLRDWMFVLWIVSTTDVTYFVRQGFGVYSRNRVITSAWSSSSPVGVAQHRSSYLTSTGPNVILCGYARRVWFLQTFISFWCADDLKLFLLKRLVRERHRGAKERYWSYCPCGVVSIVR